MQILYVNIQTFFFLNNFNRDVKLVDIARQTQLLNQKSCVAYSISYKMIFGLQVVFNMKQSLYQKITTKFQYL